MPCNFQKCAGQRFAGSTSKGWIVLALLLLFLNGTDEATGDVAFRGRFDQGVALLRTVTELLLHFLNASFEAFEDLFGFFADLSQLPIREVGHVCDEDFAVISECQECWPSTLSVALLPVWARREWTSWWNRTGRRSTARRALRLIEGHCKKMY